MLLNNFTSYYASFACNALLRKKRQQLRSRQPTTFKGSYAYGFPEHHIRLKLELLVKSSEAVYDRPNLSPDCSIW